MTNVAILCTAQGHLGATVTTAVTSRAVQPVGVVALIGRLGTNRTVGSVIRVIRVTTWRQ